MDTVLFVFQFQRAHLEGKKNLKVDLSRQPRVSYITIAFPDAMHFVGKRYEHCTFKDGSYCLLEQSTI